MAADMVAVVIRSADGGCMTAPVLDVADTGPFLKWAGGKGHMVNQLLTDFIPTEMGSYFEPFVGAGAVFFALQAHRRLEYGATLSDMCSPLIDSYQVIQRRVETLVRALEALAPCTGSHWFYHLREELNRGEAFEPSWLPKGERKSHKVGRLDPVGRAARFIVVNRRGFNGLWRVNGDGTCNVPWGDPKGKAEPDIVRADVLRTAALALDENVEVVYSDFEAIIDQAQTGDFIFADPPYLPVKTTGTASFSGYSGEFGQLEHIRLANALRRAHDRGVRWVACNGAVPLVYDLYKGFVITAIDARRSINSDATQRGAVKEFLILNYTPPGWKK